MLDAILPFDSTASNVCHNTGSVGLTQAYTERKEMIRNCQYDAARIWLESKKKWFGRSWQVQKKEGRIKLSMKVFSLLCKWIDKRSYCIFELRRKIRDLTLHHLQVHMYQELTTVPTGLIALLLSRALHQYRRGYGCNSCSGLDFFLRP